MYNSNQLKADLHIHSLFSSDGEYQVSEIVNRCLDKDISLFSVTDHNSVKAADEASALAEVKGLHFIPGIEIDCNYKGTDLHVLGYHINYNSPDFVALEKDIADKVMGSFAEMIANLNRLGFVIDAESVLAKSDGKLPSGELIAEVMLAEERFYSPLLIPYMEGGERSDMPYINFYLDYFAQGKPAFVPIEYMDYKDAIELIKDNGGIPIVAHPGLNLKGREEVVEALLDNGAEGLEVFNNYHTSEQINYFASVVQRRNVLMTCGSDFHGKTKPLIDIGQYKFDAIYKEYLEDSLYRLKRE